MNNVTVFDLETIPDESKLHLLPKPEPDSRLKDPRKIAEDIKKKKGEQIKTAGLDPNFGRICCVELRNHQGASSILYKSETDILKEIWNVLSEFQYFATFNGLSFDVPFLLKRSWFAGVKPSVKIDMAKYRIGNHFDLRAILNNWDNYASGTLDTYGQLKLGKGKTEGMDGSMVYEMWKNGRFDEIKKYAEDDAELTWELFLSMKGYFF